MKNVKVIVGYLMSCVMLVMLVALQGYGQTRSARGREAVDLIITNGTIVTMDKELRVIDNGSVAVRGNEIVAVDKSANINSKYVARTIINARGHAVIPGLVNAHTHIPMTLFRGLGSDLDLNEWLTKYIFPAEAKNVTEAFVRAGTRLGLVEMIQGGTTTFCDMYYFEDAIADETNKAGVRAVLGETVIDFPAPDNKTHEAALAYAERFINRWRSSSLIVPAIAPHAPYTVSEQHLMNVRRLADKSNAPVLIHVSETKKEVEDIKRDKGASPVAYLARINFLRTPNNANSRTIAAHLVHVDDADIALLKGFEVGVAHNPESNMKLASGIAPVPQMIRSNLRLGLGTDGAASNNDLDMWSEIDTAAKLHKVASMNPKVVTAREAFAMATIGGARALHLENKIGSIEVGKAADIVVVDLSNAHQTPNDDVYATLAYATKASDVRSVFINGRAVMLNRRLLTLNEVTIKREAEAYRARIRQSLMSNN